MRGGGYYEGDLRGQSPKSKVVKIIYFTTPISQHKKSGFCVLSSNCIVETICEHSSTAVKYNYVQYCTVVKHCFTAAQL